MNILMVGNGKGSFQMRAVQLGVALGARVTSAPSAEDFAWSDLVILVKRAILQFGRLAARSGKPIVWDALDFWSQPAQNGLDEASAVAAFHAHADPVRPVLTICATESMAKSCGGVYLPHQCREGLMPTPPREHVQTVGYDGSPAYLDRWAPALQSACAARGWSFVVNPPALSAVDILVALRGGIWDGWICREWKSGVKLVNAIVAGRPVITQASAAFRELDPMGIAIETLGDLAHALDDFSDFNSRQNTYAASLLRAHAYSVTAIASRCRAILSEARCAA